MTKQAFLNLIAQQEEWASAMLKNCEQLRTWVEKMKPTDVLPITKDGQKGCVTPSTTKRRASYHSSHFFSTPTFLYKYLAPRFDGNKRLAILYRLLAKEYRETKSYIAPETTPDAFFNLFSGRRGSDVVVWTGSKQNLYYFVKRLVERQIVTLPAGTTIWTITQNHFSDRRGNMFLNLRNQHNPKTSAPAIEKLIDILDPSAMSETNEVFSVS